jgi:UDP-N-acetyl-2-amino-2-deoxyglucuronate dehydrogenase
MKGKDLLRFGIVGCGVIGTVHARAIQSLPEARLVAVADVPTVWNKVEELAGRYQAKAYASLDDMLIETPVDIVNICTPSGLHAAQAIQVMQTGRHVMVEKPMALTRPSIEEMLQVQGAADVKLAVISQHRFDPSARRLHRLIARKCFGRISLGIAHVSWWRAQAYYNSAGWRGTQVMDGGVLFNQAIHCVDLLLWLLGPVDGVIGYTGTLAHRMETEDTAVGILRFRRGALGAITATTAAFPERQTRIEILGEFGSAILAGDRLEFLELKGEESIATVDVEDRRFGDSHQAQIADMIEAVREDRPPLVDGVEGRRAVDAILAILESAETGSEVTI